MDLLRKGRQSVGLRDGKRAKGWWWITPHTWLVCLMTTHNYPFIPYSIAIFHIFPSRSCPVKPLKLLWKNCSVTSHIPCICSSWFPPCIHGKFKHWPHNFLSSYKSCKARKQVKWVKLQRQEIGTRGESPFLICLREQTMTTKPPHLQSRDPTHGSDQTRYGNRAYVSPCSVEFHLVWTYQLIFDVETY